MDLSQEALDIAFKSCNKLTKLANQRSFEYSPWLRWPGPHLQLLLPQIAEQRDTMLPQPCLAKPEVEGSPVGTGSQLGNV